MGRLDGEEYPAYDAMVSKLLEHKFLPEKEVLQLCERARSLLSEESNVHGVRAPVTVVGDIHGQFHDMLEMFKLGGPAPDTNYLSLGDYVDRYYSVETVTLVVALKVRYPDRVTIIRGTQRGRSRRCTGFTTSACVSTATPACGRRSSISTHAAHGCRRKPDLLPARRPQSQHRQPGRRAQDRPLPGGHRPVATRWVRPRRPGWGMSPRGAGYTFGQDITEQFNHANGLKTIARAHQLVMEGYLWHHDQGLVTVFSAPNYCYRCGNQASIMEVADDGSVEFLQYDPAPRRGEEQQSAKRCPDYFL